jgi:hypothetical protein
LVVAQEISIAVFKTSWSEENHMRGSIRKRYKDSWNIILDERTQNAFRLKVARAEIFRVQGILRPW